MIRRFRFFDAPACVFGFHALRCAALWLLLPLSFAHAQEAAEFSAAVVEERARQLAQEAFAPPDAVPSALLELSVEQWKRLHVGQTQELWNDQPPGFGVRFFAPGAMYNRQVRIHVVENGQSAELPFRPEWFNSGESSPETAQALGQAGFAGFSLTYPLSEAHSEEELVTFLGASLFRAMGRNAQLGVQARGLALNTALPGGEEFPYFREFWLVRPGHDDQTMTVHALLDSPSLSGAYRFVIQPGTSTVMDVDCLLFPRQGAQLPLKTGIAPLGGMFLSSESRGAFPGDYRPEAHTADGLLLSTDAGWQWRPLRNGERLGIHAFEASRLRGFGLLQRDDNFDHYQDIDARFEHGASLWVEPHGDWGQGHVELIEIPTKNDANNNITAFWVQGAPNDGGSPPSPADAAGQGLRLSYRLYWMTPGVTPHTLGKVTATRITLSPQDGTLRFVLDFEGAILSELPADTGLTSIVELPRDVELLNKHLVKNPVTRGWRLSFRVRMPAGDGVVQAILSAREGANSLRLRATLKKGENIPDPLTEMWVYDYLP